MRRFLPALLLTVTLAASGCERAGSLDPMEPDDPERPTLALVQARIFSTSCALSGCHVGAGAPLGLDLSDGQAFRNTVGVPSEERPALLRIAPGDPDASYLVHKIEGGPDIVGGRMPLGRAPLSAENIALVRAWIAAGASESD